MDVGFKYLQVGQSRTDVTSFCMQLETTQAWGVWTGVWLVRERLLLHGESGVVKER